MNFTEKIQKFMRGRYGPDDLYMFLLKIYIILMILNLFINSEIITVIGLIIIVIMFYRFFSKRIYIRSNENQKFLKFKSKVTNPFNNIKRNTHDKNHIYKKCHKCKTTLKLPLPIKRGINYAKCPKCKGRVTLFTLKKEKIEIIKNKK